MKKKILHSFKHNGLRLHNYCHPIAGLCACLLLIYSDIFST